MRRWRGLGLALALLGWAAACAAQEGPPVVRSEKLKNGLRVLLAPDTLAPSVDVAVWYRAGTRYEPSGMSGITHLMERWMFRGSPHYKAGEHRRIVQAEGGVASTFTTSDASCFFDTVPAGDAYVLSKILHDWNDERAAAILRTIQTTARKGARLLLIESVVGAGNEPQGTKWLDLLMLVLVDGRERTETEWRALLGDAGFDVESAEDGLIQARCR